jgi:HSP20 family protein
MARVPQPWMHFRSLEDFRHEIDDVFSRSLGAAQQASLVPGLPPTESFLDGKEFVIRLDLPGIDPTEIEVTVMENVVTVRGSREHHDKQESWNVIHCELTHDDFERKLMLP